MRCVEDNMEHFCKSNIFVLLIWTSFSDHWINLQIILIKNYLIRHFEKVHLSMYKNQSKVAKIAGSTKAVAWEMSGKLLMKNNCSQFANFVLIHLFRFWRFIHEDMNMMHAVHFQPNSRQRDDAGCIRILLKHEVCSRANIVHLTSHA